MTINTWLMILTLTAGIGTSQSIESSPTTTETKWREEDNCYKNGIWYNPCPTDPEPPPPIDPTQSFDQP